VNLDLFSGVGGWEYLSRDLGLDFLGLEIDSNAVKTSRAAGLQVYHLDVAMQDPKSFGSVRGLVASPPCQTFSMAGDGTGRRALDVVKMAIHEIAAGWWPRTLLESTGDVRTSLVLQPLRYVLELTPEWIAWEQVPTVLPVWEACARVLRAHGYHVITGILNAEQYGVPQTRKRAFLIAHRHRVVGFPEPTHSKYYPRDPQRLDAGVPRWVSMAEALGAAGPFVVRSNYGTAGVAADRGERSSDEPAATVTSKCDRNRVTFVQSAMSKATQRTLDQPAPTITAAHDFCERTWVLRNNNQEKSCGRSIDAPAGTLFFGKRVNTVVWESETETRQVSLAEAAVLQTFPASYPFHGGKSAQFLQVGNAIPPVLARAVISAIV
jgi:DNA (cytosine-5)-methyltransferase 1